MRVPLTESKRLLTFLSSNQDYDFSDLKYELIMNLPYAIIPGRKEKLIEHLESVKQEFAGQSYMLYMHAALIISIRRNLNKEVNLKRLKLLWKQNTTYLLKSLNLRWLISMCDTLAASDRQSSVRVNATLVSLVASTVKIYETERLLGPLPQAQPTITKRPFQLFDGLTSYSIGKGDMLQNNVERIEATLSVNSNSLESSIFKEVISRLFGNNTALKRVKDLQKGYRFKPLTLIPNNIPASKDTYKSIIDNGLLKKKTEGFVIVNDTSALSNGFHCGTNFAMNSLRNGMKIRGATELGWANSLDGFKRLLKLHKKNIRLCVINGEGALHHNSERTLEILEICKFAKKSNINVALINTVWDSNSFESEEIIAQCDYISFRDSRSKNSVKKHLKVAVNVVPDMSFLTFSEIFANGYFSPARHQISVIDSVEPKLTRNLYEFASNHQLNFYCMPVNSLNRSLGLYSKSITPAAMPRLLTLPDVAGSSAWITGRFHGMIASLCAGKPTFALPSNTFKIEALLEDMGLNDRVLLNSNWPSLNHEEQLEAVNERISKWSNDVSLHVKTYISKTNGEINDMFDDLVEMIC